MSEKPASVHDAPMQSSLLPDEAPEAAVLAASSALHGTPGHRDELRGFLTGAPGPGVTEHLPGEHVSVYVPTTPNPTSGFFLMMPKADVVELDMTVDDALKYIISMGVVVPGGPDSIPLAAPAAAQQSS